MKNRTSKALVTKKLLPKAMEYLENHIDFQVAGIDRYPTKDEIIDRIKDKQGLVSLLVDRIDKDIIQAAPDLKIIANCAVGYNNIDVSHATERGIWVTNTPGVLTNTTADLTWGLILSVARRIPQADRFTRNKKYKNWELDLFLGQDLEGKQLGIIGMGRIGKAVALRAQPFHLKIVYTDPIKLSPEEEQIHKASYLPLEDLLKTSDIITIHTTLNKETHHLISKKNIHMIKEQAILINVSRGQVVEEKALAQALKRRTLWAAGLDVYENEPEIEENLLSLDNAVLLPHIGSASIETRLKMSMMAVKNLVAVLSGKKPLNPVNQI
ncbi:MAG: D-glycerate dehydrogenase [Candidatus Aminicenantes bacterium]|nr:D-glycerate dehydrogenase [Candidatus Aminicenantes bacterium]